MAGIKRGRPAKIKPINESVGIEPKLKHENKELILYPGNETMEVFQPDFFEIIGKLVKKFQARYGVKLTYIHKFRAFKLKRANQHVDWITLNDLTKRYDCRMPPVKMTTHPQRPFINKRVY